MRVGWHDEEIDRIETREDLVRYLASLARRIETGDVQLAHGRIGDYIEAASAWTGSMDGYFANIIGAPVPDQPDWKMIAAIFTAATIYE